MIKSNNFTYWILTIVVGIVIAVSSHYIIKNASEVPIEKQIETENTKSESSSNIESKRERKNFIGKVGKWNANFDLTFDYMKKSVNGIYSYPKRPGVVYELKGTFSKGSLTLIEYTDDRISAECILTPTSNGNCYEGIMKNTDGRNLDMKLCEK